MKKLAVILCLSALTTGVFAQGLINFANGPTTLISVDGANIPSGQGGSYWFALLAGNSGSTDYHTAFTQVGGVMGTNQNAAGRFTGGVGLTMQGWAAGDTKSFFVVGWSADNGGTFNPAWLAQGTGARTIYGDFAGPSKGFFGVSMIAVGVGGGGPLGIPNLIPFGASTIASGFNLVPVPEPTTMALAGLGAAALLIFRRRK